MQENKFENQVQQQMEEFRIRPSEAVWEKVEEELQKKKKRRVVFYLFLFAGLSLLGYSGYFVYSNSKSNLVQHIIKVPHDKDKPIKENEQLPTIDYPTSKLLQLQEENQLSVETKSNSQQSDKVNKLTNEEKSTSSATSNIGLKERKITTKEKFVVNRQEKVTNNLTTKKSLPVENINEDNVDVNIKPVKSPEKSLLNNGDKETTIINKTEVYQPAVAEIKLNDDKEISSLDNNILVMKDSLSEEIAVINNEIPAAKIKLKQGPNIKWGIDLSVGISNFKENVFSIYDGQKSILMDYNSSPASGGVGNATAGIRSPSSTQSNPAFRFGIVGEMKISGKSNISSGLRYSYYSNRIQVGTYTDTVIAVRNSFSQASSVAAVYRGIYHHEYNNRFHFIQLPIQYHLQLNKGVKLPILWNAGVSVGYLFSTNSLVYDTTAGGIYYRNKDAFNKVQFNLNTGFSFRFGNKSKVQWSLGPELSLGLNKLMKSDFTGKQYLLYSGITGRVMFSKKK